MVANASRDGKSTRLRSNTPYMIVPRLHCHLPACLSHLSELQVRHIGNELVPIATMITAEGITSAARSMALLPHHPS
jgi:hypothetical protein